MTKNKPFRVLLIAMILLSAFHLMLFLSTSYQSIQRGLAIIGGLVYIASPVTLVLVALLCAAAAILMIRKSNDTLCYVIVIALGVLNVLIYTMNREKWETFFHL